MKKISFLFLLLLFLVLPSINAQPPFQAGSGDIGYDIRFLGLAPLRQNTQFILNIHLSNKTDGAPIDNSTVICYIDLYNSTGSHLIKDLPLDFEPLFDFTTIIDAANFSQSGKYAGSIACNNTDSSLSGFLRITFLVTSTGIEVTEADATASLYVFGMTGALFILLFLTTLAIPFRDVRNDTGQLLSVNAFKPLKVLAGFMTFLVFVFISAISYDITAGILVLETASKLFHILFIINLIIIAPAFIITMYAMAVMFITGKKLQDSINKGIPVS